MWWQAILELIWKNVSPQLRELIESSVKHWEEMAKNTQTPIDDIVVTFVKWLLKIE